MDTFFDEGRQQRLVKHENSLCPQTEAYGVELDDSK